MVSTRGLKVIGRGAFSTCYDRGDKVLLLSCCPVKEILSRGWVESDRYPVLEQLDYSDKGCFYQMVKYERNKSLKNSLLPDEYMLYRNLSQLATEFQNACCGLRFNQHDRYSVFYRMVNECENLSDDIKESLIEMADNLANYTAQLGFEVSPRNVAVSNGKLVFLDLFFSLELLRNMRGN